MRAKSKTNKVIDIVLSEEKFYFPGETIRGSVIIQPKSSIKINPIIVKFSGSIYVSDKEAISLFQSFKTIEGKSKLEQKLYNFSFDFLVPDNLPSALDFGKKKLARIEYKLTAVLDRPMMPESLCPKIEYPVTILEFVDVTKDSFNRPAEKMKEIPASDCGKCHVHLSVPRSGSSCVRKDALVVDFIRKVKIQTAKNRIEEEHVLKSNKFDLNIIGPYNFTQSIASQLIIRNTPPTVRYKGKILKIHYKLRAQVILEDKKSASDSFFVELPIVVGTWPPADVPIDDDEEEDIIHYMGEMMMSDDEDDNDSIWIEDSEISDVKRQNSNASTASSSRLSDSNVLAINKSSSTPDLLINPVSQQPHNRYSYEHRSSRSMQSFAFTPTVSPTHHKRVGSEDFNIHRNVPNHTLTYLSSTTTSSNMSPSNTHNNNIITINATTSNTPVNSSFFSSSSSSSEDEDDLFAIIEKKKKRTEKELKRKQKMMYSIN
ncbi:hypothetical protein G6F37_007281 [Rhizopus arrhizus]|nr:hypothetical protein G6F38_010775 [Rhizopus arrhizus]KAG1156798.1 hypothetical protein G6F37_007281 [Rhizopus arrhizus]